MVALSKEEILARRSKIQAHKLDKLDLVAPPTKRGYIDILKLWDRLVFTLSRELRINNFLALQNDLMDFQMLLKPIG
jgi:hypothetical protein